MSSPMWNFLTAEPMPFGGDLRVGLSPPKARNGTTRNWASESLSNYRLSSKPWDWKYDLETSGFENAMARSKAPESALSAGDIPFTTPRTEGDIVSACEAQLIVPLCAIARSWAAEMNLLDSCIHTKYMHIDLESLSESIGQVVKAPQLATAVDEVVSDLANISITESKERHAPALIGVTRADKVIVFSHDPTKEPPGIQTRQGERNNQWLEGDSALDRKALSPRMRSSSSNNVYLQLSQFFNINTGAELRDEIVKGDKLVLKGLVAVEFKKAGHIVPYEVKRIADEKKSLAGGGGALEGTMSILQQSVRYGYHYGVDCIYVTDYLNVIVAKLPRQARSEVDTGKEQTLFVDWAVVERKDARLLLAYLLWKGMVDLKGLLKEADKFAAAATAEKQTTIRRPQTVSGNNQHSSSERGYGLGR